MRTIEAQGQTIFFPSRKDIENLNVGDMAPDYCGRLAEVKSITIMRKDKSGRLFVHYYVKQGEHGSTVSDSLKEDTLHRNIRTSRDFTSADLDVIERLERKKVGVSDDNRRWNGLAYVHDYPVEGCQCGSCAHYFQNLKKKGAA